MSCIDLPVVNAVALGIIKSRCTSLRRMTSSPDCIRWGGWAARTPAAGNTSWRLTVNELLASVVEAHGGLDRWRRFHRVGATIVTGGTFWGMKNLTQDQSPRRMTVSLHEERLVGHDRGTSFQGTPS